MFQKIDWLDRAVSPGVLTVLVAALLLVILAGAIWLTVKKGFTAGLWLFLAFVLVAGLFALRFVPLGVVTQSDLAAEDLPALTYYEADGLPLLPENEIDTEFLSQLGAILGQARCRRVLYPEASSGARYQKVALSVKVREAWSTGGDGGDTMVSYDLVIYAGYGEEGEAYNAEDVKGEENA